ncbi:MAG: hypothetical protein ACOC22_01010, partial [bacterium]
MPWTIKDVDKHKKDLSAKQKKKWVAVANRVLKDCQEKDGKNCDAKAIKAANSSTVKSNSLQVNFLTATDYEVRNEIINNEEHLVVPVVMMVEGVHNGNMGPIMHYAEDLGKSVSQWEGKPVTIDHPEIDGVYVSAEEVESTVGFVRNAKMDGTKLKAEACLNVNRLTAISPETID